MTGTRTCVVCLLLSILPGVLVGQTGAGSLATNEPLNANAEFMASIQREATPPDVVLPPDTDLLQYTRESLGLGPEDYVAPLIVSAADANGDSQTSDYFFSFGSGQYILTDGCHMAPAYFPHGGGAATVTVDNFFIFALDNGPGDVTFNLWRKNTLDTSSPTIMGTVTTSGASPNIQVLGDTSIANAIVTNQFAYYITWCHTGSSQAVLGFWLFYTES